MIMPLRAVSHGLPSYVPDRRVVDYVPLHYLVISLFTVYRLQIYNGFNRKLCMRLVSFPSIFNNYRECIK